MKEHTRELLQLIRQNRTFVLVAFFILLFMLVFGLATESGQQLLSLTGFKEAGTLEIELARSEAEVYIDGRRREPDSVVNGHLSFPHLSPGSHTVLLGGHRYFPWIKTVELEADQTRHLRPFLIPREPRVKPIEPASPRAREIREALRFSPPPGPFNRVVSPNGELEVWFENEVIKARWLEETAKRPSFFCQPDGPCQDTITVTPTKTPIRDLAFYGDRLDVVLLAAEEGIYVLEITADDIQNFQPVYLGESPRFLKTGTNSLTVLDEGQLRELEL